MYKFLTVLLCTTVYSYANFTMIGLYELNVQIGENHFVDYLTIEVIDNGVVNGEFEVPGVFKSPFNGLNLKNVIRGSFMANERGESYEVFLEAKFYNSGCSVNGELFLKDSSLGSFNGKRSDCHE